MAKFIPKKGSIQEVGAKALLELNLAEAVKGNKKGFFRHINKNSKTRENMDSLLKEAGDLMIFEQTW